MRLPETIRAAFVIARRDFTATVLSKTFLFFLLGPLFPIALGFIFGGIGAQVERNAAPATVAVVSSPADFAQLNAARNRLSPLGTDRPLVALHRVDPEPDAAAQRQRLLTSADEPILGVLEGGLERGGNALSVIVVGVGHGGGLHAAIHHDLRQDHSFARVRRRGAEEQPVVLQRREAG